MKRIILIGILGLFSIKCLKAQGIKFSNDKNWEQIQTDAKAQNKYIFLDAYTTWCGPCKMMSAETFTKKIVGDEVNDKFISVQVQMDKTVSDNPLVKSWYSASKKLSENYEIRAYPTMLFFSPDGKMINKVEGFLNADQFIKEVRKTISLNNRYNPLLVKFRKGLMDSKEMRYLVALADSLKDDYNSRVVAQKYMMTIPKKEFYQKENLIFISNHLTGSKDRNFKMFYTDSARINKILYKGFSELTIMGVVYREEIAPYDQSEKPDWNAIERKSIEKFGMLGQERVWGNRMVFYESKKDWVNFAKYYKLYFDRAIPNERSFIHINNLSWPVVEHVTDRVVLDAAIKTMQYDIKKNDNSDPNAMDTYANLLYKVGLKKDAVEAEALAVKLSHNGKEFVDVLDKMRRDEFPWPLADK